MKYPYYCPVCKVHDNTLNILAMSTTKHYTGTSLNFTCSQKKVPITHIFNGTHYYFTDMPGLSYIIVLPFRITQHYDIQKSFFESVKTHNQLGITWNQIGNTPLMEDEVAILAAPRIKSLLAFS
jgi:hypothetical protein